jgi:GDP-L-fucose synthase
MNDNKILVAGGTGLLGVNLTRHLVGIGASVQSTYFSRQPPEHLKQYYKRYDFTKYDDCRDATEGNDCVIICAVQASGVSGMMKNPTETILPNLEIHAGLFEACSQNKVQKVLWVSSSTAYQESFHPIREEEMDLNQQPFNLYQGVGWVYRYLEQLTKCYNQKYGLHYNVIRTSNIYGPYDRFDDMKSHVIPALIKRAVQKEDPYIVWGNGCTVRDFVYVDDLVEGILRVLERQCLPDPVNVSNGTPVKIRDLVQIILNICDHQVIPQYDSTKPTAVPYRVLDNTKYDTLFGKIKRTSLEDGIRKTVKWYLSPESRE